MIRVYRLIARILTIVLFVFVLIVFIDILRSLNGNKTVLVHLHHNIMDVFTVSIIWIAAYIVLVYVNIISKRKWKRVGLLTMGIVIITISSFVLLDEYSNKANTDSLRYVQLVFSKDKVNVDIRCEENAKRAFELFSERFDVAAIRDIRHFPILGRHIFLVKAEGIKPFVIDISVSYNQTIFAWIHLEGDE